MRNPVPLSELTGVGADAMIVMETEANGGHFNTGNYVYSLMPIYTSYSTAEGITVSDKLPG